MAGLLDLFSGDAGLLTGLALMDAGSAKPVRTSLGGGLLSALTNTQQVLQSQEDRTQRQKMQALQEQQLMQALASHKFQQEEAMRQAQRSRDMENLPQQFMVPGMKPDTMDNRDVGQPGEPRVPSQGFDLAGYANAMMRYDPKTGLGLQQLLKKDTTPIKLGKDESLLDPTTFKPLYQNQGQPDLPSQVREYQFAVWQGYRGKFEDWAREQANLKAPKAPVVNLYNNDQSKAETDLRKEFADLPQVKRFNSAIPAYKAIEDAATRNTTQADINLVYGIAKLYDPESVVREGEYATIANSQSIPEKIKGMAQYLSGGGRLTPETKSQLLTEARGRIGAFKQEHDAARKTYTDVATRRKLDPQNIFIGPADVQPPTVSSGDDIAAAARAELERRRKGK